VFIFSLLAYTKRLTYVAKRYFRQLLNIGVLPYNLSVGIWTSGLFGLADRHARRVDRLLTDYAHDSPVISWKLVGSFSDLAECLYFSHFTKFHTEIVRTLLYVFIGIFSYVMAWNYWFHIFTVAYVRTSEEPYNYMCSHYYYYTTTITPTTYPANFCRPVTTLLWWRSYLTTVCQGHG